MNFILTGGESGPQLIRQLVGLRIIARRLLVRRQNNSDFLAAHKGSSSAALDEVEEVQLQIRFAVVEIGRYLRTLCTELDRKVSHEAIFDAISTNRAHRHSDEVKKYGNNASGILFVLDLENSATRDEAITTRPLRWCHTMAFMNALRTNEKLDRIVHDEANSVFGGAFGNYRERPLVERLVG